MSTMQGKYTIVSQVDKPVWDEQLQAALDGTTVTVRSVQSGQVFSVFVPRDRFSPENVDLLVRHKLEIVDAVHNLGQ